MVSFVGELLSEIVQSIMRDGLISGVKSILTKKKPASKDWGREAILAKRKKDRSNRQRRK